MIYRDTMLKSDLGHSSTELASLPARSVPLLRRLPARIVTLVLFSRDIPHLTAGQLRSQTRGRSSCINSRTNPAEKRRV